MTYAEVFNERKNKLKVYLKGLPEAQQKNALFVFDSMAYDAFVQLAWGKLYAEALQKALNCDEDGLVKHMVEMYGNNGVAGYGMRAEELKAEVAKNYIAEELDF